MCTVFDESVCVKDRDFVYKKCVYSFFGDVCNLDDCNNTLKYIYDTNARAISSFHLHHEKYPSELIACIKSYGGFRSRASLSSKKGSQRAWAQRFAAANDPNFTKMVCYNCHMHRVHVGSQNPGGRPLMMNSKYTSADVRFIYAYIKVHLLLNSPMFWQKKILMQTQQVLCYDLYMY